MYTKISIYTGGVDAKMQQLGSTITACDQRSSSLSLCACMSKHTGSGMRGSYLIKLACHALMDVIIVASAL